MSEFLVRRGSACFFASVDIHGTGCHLDAESSAAEVLASLRKLAHLPPLDIGRRIDVDTSEEPNLTDVVRAIRGALEVLE